MKGRDGLVGVDVGTARVKAVAFTLDGAELAQADRPTPWVRDGAHVEMDPGELADVVRRVVADVAAAAGARVRGVGATGMAEAGVLVDRRGTVLAPIVAWHDPRGDVETLRREIGAAAFEQSVGMRLDAQPSLAKIVWLGDVQPGVARAVRFLSVPEWAIASLGGSPESELSLASRTGLYDLHERGPFAGATALLGRDLLGEVVVAGTPAGTADDALPEEVRGAVLTVAGHDHQAAALAAGAARPDVLFNSLGSAEALVRCIEGGLDAHVVGRLVDRGFTAGWGVVRGRSVVTGGLRTGLLLEEVAALVGAGDPAARRRLGEEAARLELGDFPPGFLAAESVPEMLARGVSPAAIWGAAVRDLGARSAGLLERLTAELGPNERVVIGGGWTRNAAVLAEKRRRFGEVTVSTLSEAGAAGAALLAGVAADILEAPESEPLPIWSLRTAVPQERKAL